MAYKYDLQIDQNSDYQQTFKYVQADEDGNPTDTPVDLTGYTAASQIRYHNNNGEIAVDMTTENGMIEIEPLVGEITIKIPSASTALLKDNTPMVYDLLLIQTETVRFLEGKVELNEGVTHVV